MERSMLSLLITLKRLEALDKRRERIEKHPWMRIMYLLRDLVPVIWFGAFLSIIIMGFVIVYWTFQVNVTAGALLAIFWYLVSRTLFRLRFVDLHQTLLTP